MSRLLVFCLCAMACAPGTAALAATAFPPAHPAWLVNVASRCPELRIADDEAIAPAVVTLMVSAGGVPSQARIERSSGSADLDAAALACTTKLRFQPLTRMGDGVPIDAWQQISWRWARNAAGASAAATAPAVAPPAPAAPLAVSAGTTAAGAAGERSGARTAAVRVCSAAAGAAPEASLTRSSGDAASDQRALGMARSALRADAAAVPGAAPGCIGMTFRFENP